MATTIGCDPPRHEQDEWLTATLSGPVAFELEGDTLVLTTGTTRFVLSDREVVSPDVPLAGTEWQLDTLTEGEVAGGFPDMGPRSPSPPTTPTPSTPGATPVPAPSGWVRRP